VAHANRVYTIHIYQKFLSVGMHILSFPLAQILSKVEIF